MPQRVGPKPRKNWAPKGGATKGGGAQNFALFSLSRHHFVLFVSLWGSSRGFLVVFVKRRGRQMFTFPRSRRGFTRQLGRGVQRKGSGGRDLAQGGPNQQPHHQHEPQTQQQTTNNKHHTNHNNTTRIAKQTTTHNKTHKNTNTHTNNNPHPHQPTTQCNTQKWIGQNWIGQNWLAKWAGQKWIGQNWIGQSRP